MCISALLLLHRHSILHLWLRVSTLAALINISFTLYANGRYTVGWYVSRVNGLMAATLVLCALLYEVNKLYTKLVQQNEELARQIGYKAISSQSWDTNSELRLPAYLVSAR